MDWLGRVRGAARRAAARLVPAERRDWVEAVWAEAPEVPSGLRRLAWRAGGVRLVAREALTRRGIGNATLFAVAAALAAWAAWPGSAAGFAASVDRVDVITAVGLLGALALVARRIFGPPGRSWVARALRISAYAAILALMPAKNVIEQILDVPPRGGTDLRLYRLIADSGFGNHWGGEIIFLIVMTLFAAVILWLTSQRSRVAPATLAVGAGAGIVAGVVLYAVVPLGLSNAATNPWLPGSDADPLVVLAWVLMVFAPVAAGAAAYRYNRAAGSVQPISVSVRQILAAGLLTNVFGALLVTILGTGTIAAMLTAPWLRSWLYRSHPLAGVGGLRLLVRDNPAALAYSHQITAAVDAPPFLIVCLVFPLLALALSGLEALIVWGRARLHAVQGMNGVLSDELA
jgi:hypothetical protein